MAALISCNIDDEAFNYYSALDQYLVGRVRADISALIFSNSSREEVPAITKYQRTVFNRDIPSSRHNPQNRILAYISPAELQQILLTSQLTRADLQASLLPGAIHPRLHTPDVKITCYDGRHRLKVAAQTHIAGDRWWKIELYAIGLDNPLRAVFEQKQSEQLGHSTSPFDGEVYQKIRHHKDPMQVKAWEMQLTPNKRYNLSRLKVHADLVHALDKLLPFRGVWHALELGNIQRHLATHFYEPIICNWRHIYNVLNTITLKKQNVRDALDIPTMENLQLRAPSVCVSDYNYISQQMDLPSSKSELFCTVDDGERTAIKHAILDLEFIIPSLSTFHDNMKYLEIGANIIKTQLLDDDTFSKLNPFKTIYQAMRAHWSPPDVLLEEFREGEFRAFNPTEVEPPVYACYKQVVIAAQRQFPSLTNISPRVERKRKRAESPVIAVSDRACLWRFLKLAQLLGFSTNKITEGLRNPCESELIVPSPLAEDLHGESRERRCGKPFANSFKRLRSQLFLSNLAHLEQRPSLNPSVLFVQRDFINSFFTWSSDSESAHQVPVPSIVPDTVADRSSIGSSTTGSDPPSGSGSVGSISSPASQYSQPTGPRWSQFSLPILDESCSEEDPRLGDDSLMTDRWSFPEFESREGSNYTFAETPSPAATIESLLEPDIRDEWSEIFNVTADDLAERLSPVASSFNTELSVASQSLTGERRSFPAPLLHYRDVLNVRRSFLAPELRDWSDTSSSNPESSSAIYSATAERRSFPIPLGDRYVPNGRRSFPSPYNPGRREAEETFEFVEYDGMSTTAISTNNIVQYLQDRQGWTMMVLRGRALKTIRFEKIIDRMRKGGESYFLIAPDYEEPFRKNHLESQVLGV